MRRYLIRSSLRLKAIGFVTILLVLVGTIGTITSILQSNRLIALERQRAADSMADSLAIACELPLTVHDQVELSHLVKRFSKDESILFVVLYDVNAHVAASNIQSQSAWDAYQHGVRENKLFLLGQHNVELFGRENELGAMEVTEGSDNASTRANAKPSAGERVGLAVVAISTEPMRMAQRNHMLVTLSTMLPGIIVSSILVFMVMTRWTRRLGGLVQASERIASGDYSCAIMEGSEDEIGRLALAYEQMRVAVQQRTNDLVKANDQVRQAQIDLVQSEKMSMLGQLVAGVAHEINTPTGAILNVMTDARDHLRLLLEAVDPAMGLSEDTRLWLVQVFRRVLSVSDDHSEASHNAARRQTEQELATSGCPNARRLAPVVLGCFGGDWRGDAQVLENLKSEPVLATLEHLMALRSTTDISLVSARKIARIVRALRYYSHVGQDEMSDVNINESIDNTLVILQNNIKHVADVKVTFDPNLPVVRCVSEISQVWTNLLNNACDALEEMHRDGMGHIEVVTCQEGDCVVVRISDDGPAIPEHVMPRIFDPFFTTKPVGKGTGLGLGICRGILQRCNGRIEAINAPGWVTFKVSLPLTYATNGGETPAPKATDASPDAGPAA